MAEIETDVQFVSPSAVRKRELLKQHGMKHRKKELEAMLSANTAQKPFHPSTILVPRKVESDFLTIESESTKGTHVSVLDRANMFENVLSRQSRSENSIPYSDVDNMSDKDSLVLSEEGTVSTLSVSVSKHQQAECPRLEQLTPPGQSKTLEQFDGERIEADERREDSSMSEGASTEYIRAEEAPPFRSQTELFSSSAFMSRNKVEYRRENDRHRVDIGANSTEKQSHFSETIESLSPGFSSDDLESFDHESLTVADRIKMFENSSHLMVVPGRRIEEPPADRINADENETVQSDSLATFVCYSEDKSEFSPPSDTPKADNSSKKSFFPTCENCPSQPNTSSSSDSTVVMPQDYSENSRSDSEPTTIMGMSTASCVLAENSAFDDSKNCSCQLESFSSAESDSTGDIQCELSEKLNGLEITDGPTLQEGMDAPHHDIIAVHKAENLSVDVKEHTLCDEPVHEINPDLQTIHTKASACTPKRSNEASGKADQPKDDPSSEIKCSSVGDVWLKGVLNQEKPSSITSDQTDDILSLPGSMEVSTHEGGCEQMKESPVMITDNDDDANDKDATDDEFIDNDATKQKGNAPSPTPLNSVVSASSISQTSSTTTGENMCRNPEKDLTGQSQHAKDVFQPFMRCDSFDVGAECFPAENFEAPETLSPACLSTASINKPPTAVNVSTFGQKHNHQVMPSREWIQQFQWDSFDASDRDQKMDISNDDKSSSPNVQCTESSHANGSDEALRQESGEASTEGENCKMQRGSSSEPLSQKETSAELSADNDSLPLTEPVRVGVRPDTGRRHAQREEEHNANVADTTETETLKEGPSQHSCQSMDVTGMPSITCSDNSVSQEKFVEYNPETQQPAHTNTALTTVDSRTSRQQQTQHHRLWRLQRQKLYKKQNFDGGTDASAASYEDELQDDDDDMSRPTATLVGKKKIPLKKKDLTRRMFKTGGSAGSGLVPTPNKFFKARIVGGGKRFSSALTVDHIPGKQQYQQINHHLGEEGPNLPLAAPSIERVVVRRDTSQIDDEGSI